MGEHDQSVPSPWRENEGIAVGEKCSQPGWNIVHYSRLLLATIPNTTPTRKYGNSANISKKAKSVNYWNISDS